MRGRRLRARPTILPPRPSILTAHQASTQRRSHLGASLRPLVFRTPEHIQHPFMPFLPRHFLAHAQKESARASRPRAHPTAGFCRFGAGTPATYASNIQPRTFFLQHPTPRCFLQKWWCLATRPYPNLRQSVLGNYNNQRYSHSSLSNGLNRYKDFTFSRHHSQKRIACKQSQTRHCKSTSLPQ